MFKNVATNKALNWNLRRCIKPKKLLKIVKKDLMQRAKYGYPDRDGYVHFMIAQRVSYEGFNELKNMCYEDGIILYPEHWKSPYPEIYNFKMKIS